MLAKLLTGKAVNFFIEGCKKSGIPEDQLFKIFEVAQTSIKYYSGSKMVRAQVRELQELENKWYESLKAGNPWYDVYSANYYIADLWACWVIYSRKYLLSILSDESLSVIEGRTAIYHSIYSEMKEIKSACDLGCGLGITTASIKEFYPNAKVYGTNIMGNQQANFALLMSKQYNFDLVSSVNEIVGDIDLIFASEYFEHFYNPVDHLREILSHNPKFLLIANAFNSISIGHFPHYMVDGLLVDGKKTSKLFNDELRKHGYKKIYTHLWNNRPTYWKKEL